MISIALQMEWLKDVGKILRENRGLLYSQEPALESVGVLLGKRERGPEIAALGKDILELRISGWLGYPLLFLSCWLA